MKKITGLFILAVVITIISFPASVFAVESQRGTVGSESTESSSTGQPLIKTFTLTESGNGIYRAEWDISNVTSTVYVRIYASQTREDFSSGILAASIESGTHGSVDVYMPDIDSGYYIFYMSAAGQNGVAGYKYSDDYYFYDNQNRQEKLTDVLMCREDNDLYVAWSGDPKGCVMLYDKDTGELISRSDPSVSPCVVTLPKGHKNFLAGAAADADGLTGRFDAVDISTLKKSDDEIVMPSSGVTGSNQLEIDVKAKDSYTLRVYNNKEQVQAVSGGVDKYTVELNEGENELIVFLIDSKNLMRAAQSVMDSDTVAPELNLIGQTDDVRTADEEIVLKGYVDSDAVLKYLGEEVELAGGYFYLKKPLGFGKNQFTLTASDGAGNTTEKTVTVERVFWSPKNVVIILLAISVAAVIIIEAVLLFFHSDKKRRRVPEKREEKEVKNEDPRES